MARESQRVEGPGKQARDIQGPEHGRSVREGGLSLSEIEKLAITLEGKTREERTNKCPKP